MHIGAVSIAVAVLVSGQAESQTSGVVPNAYWNRDNGQANLNRNDPENSNPNNGARSAAEGDHD